MGTYPSLGFLVGGTFMTQSAEVMNVVNPSTEDVIGKLPVASADVVEEALRAADSGFAAWGSLTGFERGQKLLEAVNTIRPAATDIATALTLENGKPMAEARAEVIASADTLEWFAHESHRLADTWLQGRSRGSRYAVMRRPIGVVAAFTPWNFPVLTTIRKLAPALAAGCSVIVKPAEETPGAVLHALRLLGERLPAGVVNVLFGDPNAISTQLIQSPTVRKISLTGSTAVGRKLAAQAANLVKPITLELGGHAPVIVDRSVDVTAAARTAVAGKFRASGQICTSPTRFYVHQAVYAAFVSEFAERAKALVVGDGLDPASEMGPLVSGRRRDWIEELVQETVAAGATVRIGGRRLGNTGYYYMPTVLENVAPSMRLMREEPFGPIAAMLPYDDVNDAIAAANSTPYGLAGYVLSQDTARAHAIATQLDVGVVGINNFSVSAPNVPFGGVKSSGYGLEGGRDALLSYLRPLTIHQMEY